MISAQEWELLSFFAVEPQRLDPDIGWPYNDFSYVIERDDLTLTCAIAPAYKDVRLTLTRNDGTLYELNALSVADVRYRRDDGTEVIEIVLSERESIRLCVEPHISIRQVIRAGS